jgi:hypothetical protein
MIAALEIVTPIASELNIRTTNVATTRFGATGSAYCTIGAETCAATSATGRETLLLDCSVK